MLTNITRLGKHAAWETLIVEPGQGAIAYGRGITPDDSKTAARAVLDRMKNVVIGSLGREVTLAGLMAKTGMDRTTTVSLLFVLYAEQRIEVRDCPQRGPVYRRIKRKEGIQHVSS